MCALFSSLELLELLELLEDDELLELELELEEEELDPDLATAEWYFGKFPTAEIIFVPSANKMVNLYFLTIWTLEWLLEWISIH